VTSKTILIQSECLGRGDDNLGSLLMANFLRLLGESKDKPKTMVFWNTGISLLCEGSKVINHIRKLEEQGIEVLACTTCLEYLGLTDKLLVGKPTTMVRSIESIMNDDIVSL
jgi:selenium metabolism protein YedF